MAAPELWPARGVAEYAYCPRLFYYMTVEGIFLPSSDTEKGCAVHRRVDRPSAEPDEPPNGEDQERPKSVRSLALSSERLGLTATLDLFHTGLHGIHRPLRLLLNGADDAGNLASRGLRFLSQLTHLIGHN